MLYPVQYITQEDHPGIKKGTEVTATIINKVIILEKKNGYKIGLLRPPWFLRGKEYPSLENQLVDIMMQRAMDEIYFIEDNLFLRSIRKSIKK